MTLAKAREIILLNLKEAGPKMPPDCREALQIAVEALERFTLLREHPDAVGFYPLPGETEK